MKRISTLWAVPIIAIIAIIAPPISASAQPTEGHDEEARALFRAGEVAFSEGRFEAALEYFQRSYELSGRHMLLFNIANVQDRLRNLEEAVEAFERYLELVPDAPNAPFARNRVEALRAELAERAASRPPATDANADTTAQTQPSRGGDPPIAGIAFTAVGGAFLLSTVGTILWATDRAQSADICAAAPSCVNGDVVATERDAALGTTVALGVLGLAGLGVGIALIAAAGGDGESASFECLPGLTGVSCSGRF